MRSLIGLVIAVALGVVASPSVRAAQEYIVTLGPAGIWVLNVRNTSYVTTVPGDPFVPHITPAPWEANPQPVLFGLDLRGEYLYALYNTCYQLGGCDEARSELVSYRMIDGIPYQVTGVPFFAALCANCQTYLSTLAVSNHYIFLTSPEPGTIFIFSTTHGVLKEISPILNPGVSPLTLQADDNDHFLYVGYAADGVSSVPDHVAIYDITELPTRAPRLLVRTPQVGGIQLGAQ